MKSHFLLVGTVLVATAGFIGFISQDNNTHPALKGCTENGHIISCELPPNSGFSVSQEANTIVQIHKKIKP